MITNNHSQINLPAYLEIFSGDLYHSIDRLNARDNGFYCQLRSFFQYQRLVSEVVEEIKVGSNVLQMGVVSGNLTDDIAFKIASYGRCDIMDVNPLQIQRLSDKYKKIYKNLKFIKQDITTANVKNTYDAVVCFMLLSEVPSAVKSKIINCALQMVKPGGKAIFIDWHRPSICHPLRYIIRMINRLYHPFIERLWDREIQSYATPEHQSRFIWHKNTYLGHMFQKIVAEYRVNTPTTALEDRWAQHNFFD